MTLPPPLLDGDGNPYPDDVQQAMLARLAEYENAITWGVDCIMCARQLSRDYAAYAEAEELRSEVARLRAELENRSPQTREMHRADCQDRARLIGSLSTEPEIQAVKDQIATGTQSLYPLGDAILPLVERLRRSAG